MEGLGDEASRQPPIFPGLDEAPSNLKFPLWYWLLSRHAQKLKQKLAQKRSVDGSAIVCSFIETVPRSQYIGKHVGQNTSLDQLRIEMIKRGLGYRDLAALAGKSHRRIANVLAGNDRTWPIRAAINRALRSRIFSKPSNTRRRRKPAPPAESNV
jgi:hypothetical protein